MMDGLGVLGEIAAVVAIVYLGLLGLLYLFQHTLIFHPSTECPEPAACGVPEMAAVELTTEDGLPLTAWWRPPTAPTAPVLLYLHGNAGTLAHRAHKVRPYLDRGWGVLMVAWRGYSGNPGRPSEKGFYRDARAALAFIDGQGIAPDRLVLYGESIGTGVAVQMAIERTPGVLVLEAPYSSMVEAGAAHYPMFPARLVVHHRFDSLAKIGAVRAPVLLMHGEQDRVVPVRLGRKLFEAAPHPKESFYVPAAGHSDLYDFGAAETVIGFVDRHLGEKVDPIK